jgi:acetyl esterase/lipase
MTREDCHRGCRTNLLGVKPSYHLKQEVSPELHVTHETPPCFLWHTWEDPVVPVDNSLLYAEALRRQRVPFELHIYQSGGHGLGLETDHPWGEACVRWIRAVCG